MKYFQYIRSSMEEIYFIYFLFRFRGGPSYNYVPGYFTPILCFGVGTVVHITFYTAHSFIHSFFISNPGFYRIEVSNRQYIKIIKMAGKFFQLCEPFKTVPKTAVFSRILSPTAER
uniref:Uncharacterized protein n=1 Tax=Cacopsylla melanoneura TaxID=428564 RepID=A0A8D9AZS2_9HEMI